MRWATGPRSIFRWRNSGWNAKSAITTWTSSGQLIRRALPILILEIRDESDAVENGQRRQNHPDQEPGPDPGLGVGDALRQRSRVDRVSVLGEGALQALLEERARGELKRDGADRGAVVRADPAARGGADQARAAFRRHRERAASELLAILKHYKLPSL